MRYQNTTGIRVKHGLILQDRGGVPEYEVAKRRLDELRHGPRIKQNLTQLTLAIKTCDWRLLGVALRVIHEIGYSDSALEDSNDTGSPEGSSTSSTLYQQGLRLFMRYIRV